MRVERYAVQLFSDTEPKPVNVVSVPQGSKFLALKVLHDGIYAWYEVTELEGVTMTEEKFVIMQPNKSVPDNSEFITVLDTIVDTPEGQGIMIFPVYKLN